MPEKYKRCVKAVGKKGGANAYAVCAPLRNKRKRNQDDRLSITTDDRREYIESELRSLPIGHMRVIAMEPVQRWSQNVYEIGSWGKNKFTFENAVETLIDGIDRSTSLENPKKRRKPRIRLVGSKKLRNPSGYEIRVYQDLDPLGKGEYYGYLTSEGHIFANFGPFATEEEAFAGGQEEAIRVVANPRRQAINGYFDGQPIEELEFDCQQAYYEGYDDGFDDAETEGVAFDNPKRRKNPTSWGTSYFTSLGAAIRYYKDYGYDDTKETVKRKIAEGEIHVGKPKLTAGQRLTTIDGGKRYAISENKRNPEDTAADLYESFHGREADTDTIFTEKVHEHSTFAALGDLVSMKVATIHNKEADITAADPETAQAEDIVHLASNEDGTQLFFIGGDQALDLESLGFADHELSKENVVVGIITELMYRTQKEFDQFEMIDYFHHLSEDTKRPQPSLLYDTVNQTMSMAGGSYYIDQPMGEMSPGIED